MSGNGSMLRTILFSAWGLASAALVHSKRAELRSRLSAYREFVLSQAFDRLQKQKQRASSADGDGVVRLNGAEVDVSSRKAFLASAREAVRGVPVWEFATVVGDLVGRYQNHLRFDLSPKAIQALAQELMDAHLEVTERVLAVPAEERTWENTMQPFVDFNRATSALESSIDFPGHVSADKAIRDASRAAEKVLREFDVQQSMRVDVYHALQEYNAKNPQLEGERKRLLEETIRDFRRRGLHLSEAERDRIEAIDKEKNTKCMKFSENLAECKVVLDFTADELDGLPESVMSQLPVSANDPNKFDMELNYTTVFPAMQYCKNEATRRRINYEWNRRCVDTNSALLEEVVELRQERAKILGYKNHAEFVLETRMAKTPDAVMPFLDSLNKRLQPLADAETKELLALKRAEKEERKEEFDNKLHLYDLRYYQRLAEEKKFQIDREGLRMYFPLQVVVRGMLDIYQKLLGLRFERVPKGEAHVWHPDVQMFNVFDADSNQLVGQFYFDLHPRDGKYGHAACFGLQAGSAVRRGDFLDRQQIPVSAMVCNFAKPTKDKASLLNHNEVVTLFHEFGHAMHGICSETEITRFSGTRVQRDFVEAPSQMLENWAWKSESIQQMCGHVDTNEKLPDDVLKNLVAAKNANVGMLYLRQVVFATFDMALHTAKGRVDSAALFAEHLKKIMNIDAIPNTNFAAGFGHLMGGYDASYYSYLWSEVFSADMFAQFDGVMDFDTGRKYRHKILAKGGSQDAMELLVDFLGREPTEDAFLKDLGLVD